MTTPLRTRDRGPAAACLRGLAAAALMCLLTQGAWAQDGDDDGVLPFAGDDVAEGQSTGGGGTGDAGGGNGGGGGSEALSIAPAVLVAGDLADGIDPARATLEFETAGAVTTLVTEVPADEAHLVADPPGIAAGDNGLGPVLQASGRLTLTEGLQARFVPAQSADLSVAVLVLAKDGPSLEAELAGASQPDLVVPLGAAAEVDLVKLSAVAARFAGVLPGYHATIAFVSVEAGELHVAAVRVHTQGGPLEVLVR